MDPPPPPIIKRYPPCGRQRPNPVAGWRLSLCQSNSLPAGGVEPDIAGRVGRRVDRRWGQYGALGGGGGPIIGGGSGLAMTPHASTVTTTWDGEAYTGIVIMAAVASAVSIDADLTARLRILRFILVTHFLAAESHALSSGCGLRLSGVPTRSIPVPGGRPCGCRECLVSCRRSGLQRIAADS